MAMRPYVPLRPYVPGGRNFLPRARILLWSNSKFCSEFYFQSPDGFVWDHEGVRRRARLQRRWELDGCTGI